MPFSLAEVGEVWNDPVDAQLLWVGEHHAGVDDNRRLAPRDGEHVQTELTESTDWHDFQHVVYADTSTASRYLAAPITTR